MSYLYKKIGTLLFTSILISCAGHSLAEGIANDDKPKQDSSDNRDGYSLSIGLGYVDIESPLYDGEQSEGTRLVIDGRYQWKGLFAELALNGVSGDKDLTSIGYNFYSTDHWNLDFIAAGVTGRTEFNYVFEGQVKQISGEPTKGVGFRAQGSWGNSIVQMVALPYIYDGEEKDFGSDNAVDYASLWVGHRWQVKNWSVNGLLGAVYKSSGLLDHQVGVTESEADAIVWAYEPSSGIDYTAHIDLSYPVSKNILFQIYSRHTQYSDATLDSPLIELPRKWDDRPENEHEFGALLNYVF
jgi:outer membrane protein